MTLREKIIEPLVEAQKKIFEATGFRPRMRVVLEDIVFDDLAVELGSGNSAWFRVNDRIEIVPRRMNFLTDLPSR